MSDESTRQRIEPFERAFLFKSKLEGRRARADLRSVNHTESSRIGITLMISSSIRFANCTGVLRVASEEADASLECTCIFIPVHYKHIDVRERLRRKGARLHSSRLSFLLEGGFSNGGLARASRLLSTWRGRR